MSRSGYHEDCDDPLIIGRYRGRVASAVRGKRGQAFLKEALAALDAMPEKRLIIDALEAEPTGLPFAPRQDVCLLGAVGRARQLDMSKLDPHCPERVAGAFNIAEVLAREITWENDENWYGRETPEQRWVRMRKWVASQIKDGT